MELRNITKIVRNMNLYKGSRGHENGELNSNEFEMVRYICKREYRTQVEISDYLNVDKGLITRMAKKLSSLGYITIEVSKDDSRKKLLKATQKGLSLKEESANIEDKFYSKCIEVLSEEEKETFDKLLNKVYLESKRLRKTSFKDLSNEE